MKRVLNKIISILLLPFIIIKNIILWPFKKIKNIRKDLAAKKEKLSRLNIIEENILLAKKYNLDLMISNNYENEIIISMSERDAKKATTRKVKEK